MVGILSLVFLAPSLSVAQSMNNEAQIKLLEEILSLLQKQLIVLLDIQAKQNLIPTETIKEVKKLEGFCHSGGQAEENQIVNWRVQASGGVGDYKYEWSGTDGLSGDTDSIMKSYSVIGNKVASVNITSGNESLEVKCDVYNIIKKSDTRCTGIVCTSKA